MNIKYAKYSIIVAIILVLLGGEMTARGWKLVGYLIVGSGLYILSFALNLLRECRASSKLVVLHQKVEKLLFIAAVGFCIAALVQMIKAILGFLDLGSI